MTPEELFKKTCEDLLCRSSYPIKREYFSKYKSNKDIMADTDELSFYLYVPFCKNVCKSCEYTRFVCGNEEAENRYIFKLKNQTEEYLSKHSVRLLYGLDIGGGTPTVINVKAFGELMKNVKGIIDASERIHDFESSIEFSFSSVDEKKINLIAEAGISRMSARVQVNRDRTFRECGVDSMPLYEMTNITRQIHREGIEKVNLEVIYGFSEHTEEMLINTIRTIDMIAPEQVTLREIRSPKLTRDMLFEQYSFLFRRLTAIGYKAEFGRSTFSVYDDAGVSSYNRYRRFDGIPYKGFGASAVSVSHSGISYNTFRTAESRYIPDFYRITAEQNYELPPEELVAEYVNVAVHIGQINFEVLSNIIDDNAFERYEQEVDFLKKNNFIQIYGDTCVLTSEGFRYYGAISSLFWSEHHKECYLADIN